MFIKAKRSDLGEMQKNNPNMKLQDLTNRASNGGKKVELMGGEVEAEPYSLQEKRLDETEYLMDQSDQADLMLLLEIQSEQQSFIWRRVFAVLSFCLTVWMLLFMLFQCYSPWYFRHQLLFRHVISSRTLIASYVISAFAYGSGGIIVLNNHCVAISRKMRSLLGLAVSGIPFVLWGAIFQQHHVTNPTLFWLPVGPFIFMLICFYVDKEMLELKNEVCELSDLQYKYKAL